MKTLFRIVLGFNLASFFQLLRAGPREFSIACRRAFDAARNVQLHEIPRIALGDILGERRPNIRMTVARYEDGMLASNDATALLSILVAENPREVLEIGTFMGHTTREMAENLPTAVIHTVDLPENFSEQPSDLPKDDFHLIKRRIVGREFKDHPSANRIRQHFADTAQWNFAAAGEPTFFFIDGSHTYEYVNNDSEKCLALGQGRGVFLWHDCDHNHPGVVRLIAEWRKLGRDVRRISNTSIAYWKNN